MFYISHKIIKIVLIHFDVLPTVSVEFLVKLIQQKFKLKNDEIFEIFCINFNDHISNTYY